MGEIYAADEQKFFADFAAVFEKLISNGCPAPACPHMAKMAPPSPPVKAQTASASFREHAMHGSVGAMRKAVAQGADVNSTESTSDRTALHKAAFWGHTKTIEYLVNEC